MDGCDTISAGGVIIRRLQLSKARDGSRILNSQLVRHLSKARRPRIRAYTTIYLRHASPGIQGTSRFNPRRPFVEQWRRSRMVCFKISKKLKAD